MAYVLADERRKHIIEAAIEVIAEEGLERTTTRRIAERAGTPLGTLHYCFKNKNEIVQAVADEGAAMLREAFGHVDTSKGLESTIRGDIDAWWAWYRANAGLQLALTEIGMARIRRDPPKAAYAIWDRFGRTVMREHLTEAQRHDKKKLRIPIEEIVRFVLHRFDGLTLEYAASRDRRACQRQVELLTEATLALALGKTPSPAK